MPRDTWHKLPYDTDFVPFNLYRDRQAVHLAMLMDPEALERTVVHRQGTRIYEPDNKWLETRPRYTSFGGVRIDRIKQRLTAKRALALLRRRERGTL